MEIYLSSLAVVHLKEQALSVFTENNHVHVGFLVSLYHVPCHVRIN